MSNKRDMTSSGRDRSRKNDSEMKEDLVKEEEVKVDGVKKRVFIGKDKKDESSMKELSNKDKDATKTEAKKKDSEMKEDLVEEEEVKVDGVKKRVFIGKDKKDESSMKELSNKDKDATKTEAKNKLSGRDMVEEALARADPEEYLEEYTINGVRRTLLFGEEESKHSWTREFPQGYLNESESRYDQPNNSVTNNISTSGRESRNEVEMVNLSAASEVIPVSSGLRKNYGKDQDSIMNMQKAINHYNANKGGFFNGSLVSMRSVGRQFDISKSVLERRINGKVAVNASSGRNPIFTKDEEKK
jgi:hypothetical protein